MPLTPNMLLQAASKAKPQAVSANTPAVAAGAGDRASGFAQIYAKQAQSKPAPIAEGPARPARDKVADNTGKKDAVPDTAAAPEPAVADSGKSLPADKAGDDDDKLASDDDTAADIPLADTVAVDPASVQVVPPVALAPVPEAPPAVAAVQPQVEAALAAVAIARTAVTEPEFDPEADPLDGLPAVRLALEQSGHISASSQAQAKNAPVEAEPTSAQSFASGMAATVDLQADKDSTDQGSDKAFSGLIDDGLKDLKDAASDTRVDDFANRLAALTQAATPKTANALPVNQPLAMHQSGWTEEVVNRVMYLSSANLKSADIQLQPAELGRLDIRVNMAADQPTQVTFMSGHAVVREALEGQMHRLRDMFTEQGMGQVDVNVSDQSRGWQGQEQARQGQQSRSGGRLDAADDERPMSVAEVATSTSSVVVGSSAVDYYA